MEIYNKKGIFHNSDDNYQDLENYLANKYASYEITVIGCVALFHGSAS